MPELKRSKTQRVLIWGKTYPEPSRSNVETVCTAGVTAEGRPIRLYPVPLRYLETNKQYRLYDWIDVETEKSTSDPRPESFKVVERRIEIVDHVDTDESEWAERRRFIFKDPSWQFTSLDLLKERQQADHTSLGLIRPDIVDEVSSEAVSAEELRKFGEKMSDLRSQGEFWDPQYKDLQPLENKLYVHWRCPDRCQTCRNSPHKFSVLDWGLYELARKEGEAAALSKLETLMDLRRHDTWLFLGNMRLRMQTFCIVGLWYPKRRDQWTML